MFKLKFVTPTKRIVEDMEVEEVFVPGYRGELQLLPGHAPLVTTLETGVLRYRLKGTTDLHAYAISWGYCEVHPQGVTILADTAEQPSDIDTARAEQALKQAETQLSSDALSETDRIKYQRKLKRAQVRLDTARQ